MKISAHLLLSPSCFLLAAADADAGEPRLRPKMVAREVKEEYEGGGGPNNLFDVTGDEARTISTVNSIFMGACSPNEGFVFDLGSVSGRGAIGAPCNVAGSIDVHSASHDAAKDGHGVQPNFFAEDAFPEDYAATSAEKMCGVGIEYTDKGADGTATVTCGAATDVVVILRDDDAAEVEASVSCGQGNSQTVVLSPSAAANSVAPLKGQTKASPKSENGKSPVTFKGASKSSIIVTKNQQAKGNDAGMALLTTRQANEAGGSTYRTLVTEAKSCAPGASGRRLRSVEIRSSSINEDGDVELDFDGLDELETELGEDARFKVDARISISSESDATDIIHKTVDVTTFLSRDDNTMVVHGGWVRRALHSISDGGEAYTGWDVVVEAAMISDPENNYKVVARLDDVHATGLGSDRAHRRARIAEPPTQDELVINEEMLQGRKPEISGQRGGRGLRALQSSTHKKILVHGYCSAGNPFPISQFDDDVAFADPGAPYSRRRLGGSDTDAGNWSNDLFARKIRQFAINSGIYGCGIIAHSQGGLASLHLYTYYWSCLDYAYFGRSRLIQTVGSPFQGTSLAGNLAALGEVFGAGCGTQSDLTEGGASSWLSSIPSWARAKVHYHTTSFTDKWWRYDYCNSVTDLFLSDPDDGTVAKGRGQLSGATNRGHKTGWCHTSGMRDGDQTKDSGRNSDMNYHAKY